jgi:PncC family amidohydrolase
LVIAENLVELMKARSLKFAVAESCTGGGVGSAITAVAGSSEVFAGGVIAYANEVKNSVLGVDAGMLERFGAVSGECACEMADGARRLTRADIAVSVTGIAGPGGGSAEKPVGLVWFAVSGDGATRCEKAIFAGSRDEVRRKAVEHALGMLSVAAMGERQA